MRVAIIGTVGIPASYGGFETLAEHLTRHLSLTFDFTVYCSSKHYPQKKERHNGARLIYLPLKANGVQSIPYDIVSMLHAVGRSDVLLVLGFSGCAILPLLRLFFRGSLIVHIDGLEWKREKWGFAAKRFLKFSERSAVRHADVVIVDNKAIQDYVLDEYGRKTALIEYGADHVNTAADRRPGDYAFTVCRIEPENNIHLILEAFSKAKLKYIIVGNWADDKYGLRLRETYQRCANIQMLDPIHDGKLLDDLRAGAKVYIHGHSAGGTNPSLVEAMYLGLPVVAYDVSYNRETTEGGAVYFRTSDELLEIIAGLNTGALEKISARMAEVARARYVWSAIALKYEAIIKGAK